MTTTPTSTAASSTPPTTGLPRIAGAPTSWGVCEVPDWSNGCTGWYTLEQDTILTGEPTGEGPLTDVRTSAACVRGLLTTAAAASRALTT